MEEEELIRDRFYSLYMYGIKKSIINRHIVEDCIDLEAKAKIPSIIIQYIEKNLKHNKIDFAITTVDEKIDNFEVLKVNPLVDVNDIDNIKNLIFKNNYKKQICLPVSIEMAIEAKKIGVKVIVMTNLTYSKEVT